MENKARSVREADLIAIYKPFVRQLIWIPSNNVISFGDNKEEQVPISNISEATWRCSWRVLVQISATDYSKHVWVHSKDCGCFEGSRSCNTMLIMCSICSLSIILKNAVVWDVTPCGSCKNRLFGRTWRPHHQGGSHIAFICSVRRLLVAANVPSSPILIILMMKELCSSETSNLTRGTRRNIPEGGILHSHRRENLKSYFPLPCPTPVWL
jgi:hypothetical protein